MNMVNFEKEFNEMFADLLSDAEIIKEAEKEAEAELKAYRAKKQTEFERSEAYQKARQMAIQQLKEQKLNEGKASIDEEFKEKSEKITKLINDSISTPTKLSSPMEADVKKKAETARNKAIKAMYDDLDSVAISIVFDNAGSLYSSDDIQEIVKNYGVNNAKDLTHEQIQTLLASVINDEYIQSGHIKKSLFNATNQMYSSEAIAQYVEEAIRENPDATVGNGGVITTRSKEEQKEPDDEFNF